MEWLCFDSARLLAAPGWEWLVGILVGVGGNGDDAGVSGRGGVGIERGRQVQAASHEGTQ